MRLRSACAALALALGPPCSWGLQLLLMRHFPVKEMEVGFQKKKQDTRDCLALVCNCCTVVCNNCLALSHLFRDFHSVAGSSQWSFFVLRSFFAYSMLNVNAEVMGQSRSIPTVLLDKNHPFSILGSGTRLGTGRGTAFTTGHSRFTPQTGFTAFTEIGNSTLLLGTRLKPAHHPREYLH